MYNKDKIIERLQQLDFDKSLYWITTGAAMVMYGMKECTNDIDLGCESLLLDNLTKEGHKTTLLPDGYKKMSIDSDIEIFENWGKGDIIYISSLPVLSPRSIIMVKKELAREKDFKDIKLLEEYMLRNELI